MDKPLLIDVQGEGDGSTSNGRRNSIPFRRRRFNAISHGSSYERAVALVVLAEDGIGLPEQVLESEDYGKAAKIYFIFIWFNPLWFLNLFSLLLLNFLEKPLWCEQYNSTHSCNDDRDYFFLGQLPYLSVPQSLIYEGITLVILTLHTFFPLAYEGRHYFWKDHVYKWKVVFLLILAADVVVYALLPVNSIPLRVAPYIRVVFVILNLRDLRECFVLVGGMLVTYLNILALALLFLAFSSWAGYIIFQGTQQGRTTFYSFGVTMYQMFLLFNRSNDPDVWIPAYKESRWYSLFFILYILLGVFFLSNLILAVVYDRFKAQLAGQVAKKDKLRTRILTKAFNLIDTDMESMITKGQLYRLIEELNKFRSLPKIENEEVDHIFKELDDSQDFKINLEEFWKLSNAIAFKFKKAEVPSWFDYYPNFYNSHLSKKLKGFVRSSKFGYIVFFFLLLNVVAVIIETTLDLHNRSVQRFWQEVEYIFGLIYLLEMALKIFSYGFENYWSKGRNRFAFVITWIMVIGGFTALTFPDATFLSNGEWIRYLLLARLLLLVRLLMLVPNYRNFISTFFTLIPALMPYLGTVFCISSIYCTLGMQVFGGIVNSGNPKLQSLEFYCNDYLLFNFNDYPNGMVTLFNLLVMGFWEVLMQGYKELTGTSWSLVYFISFYVITVLLLLNLVVAFVLEVFFSEIGNKEFQYSDDSSRGSSRKMQTRKAKVDALLHRILEPQIKSPEFCLDDCV
ncbi:two pore calcium channel protein 1B-like [Papaver somniferum]|uniref:two pore calcium channel protein 1B-like n=1 Tax=Papaver somniferum TaxID=3469 RepID=UPI000E6FA89B|nr:two pore calcium channel protein 1B-like [Papaver somniferum]